MFSKFKDSFYLNVFWKSFFPCLLVYSFLFFKFWWGNHDWGYIKDGVSLESGFFEARYTQHLLTLLFLDGQVLPVLTFMLSIVALVVLNILIADYLELPKNEFNYIIFCLFFSLNPHLYVFFYYVYLIFPFIAWCVVGVVALILFEKQTKASFLLGAFLFVLLLGSYPPNMALFFVLFVAKRMIAYCSDKEGFVDVVRKGLLFAVEVILGYIGFKCIYAILEYYHLINLDMYNISMRSFSLMLKDVPSEFIKSFTQLFETYSFMEIEYCALIAAPVIFAVFFVLKDDKNRWIKFLFLLFLFFVSRFVFLIALRSDIGAFRLVYFGKIGIIAFSLSVLMRLKQKYVKNFLFIWGVLSISLFVLTNFDIHKVQYLGFDAGRRYQKNLLDKVVTNENFKYEKKYISFTFGYPNFRNKFYNGRGLSSEMNEHAMVFYFDTINQLFWEENFTPVAVGAGILDNFSILRVNRDGGEFWNDQEYWLGNPENMKAIRMWLYTQAKVGDIYIDDKYILAVLDEVDFYKNRELVATSLDKEKKAPN